MALPYLQNFPDSTKRKPEANAPALAILNPSRRRLLGQTWT